MEKLQQWQSNTILKIGWYYCNTDKYSSLREAQINLRKYFLALLC